MAVLSWIPDDKEVVTFVENYQLTETLFGLSMFALEVSSDILFKEARELLVGWAVKGGKYRSGWGILEESMYALATVTSRSGTPESMTWLTRELTNKLSRERALQQTERDEVARELRRRALGQRERRTSYIHQTMALVDARVLGTILNEIANILSPGTAKEPVRQDRF
jgi:hypothetical protein